mmetsp:Transcript_15120/g.34405  ORF Transcript_15120/g.34405 Transcript_15120/m.34405 type:complete len:487 (+) Transcript_15120:91-1551(+)
MTGCLDMMPSMFEFLRSFAASPGSAFPLIRTTTSQDRLQKLHRLPTDRNGASRSASPPAKRPRRGDDEPIQYTSGVVSQVPWAKTSLVPHSLPHLTALEGDADVRGRLLSVVPHEDAPIQAEDVDMCQAEVEVQVGAEVAVSEISCAAECSDEEQGVREDSGPTQESTTSAMPDDAAPTSMSCAAECGEEEQEVREDSAAEQPQGTTAAMPDEATLTSIELADVLRRYREESSAVFHKFHNEKKTIVCPTWSPRTQLAHASSSSRLQPCASLRCHSSPVAPRIAEGHVQLAGVQCEVWSCACSKLLVEAAAKQAAQLMASSNARVLVLMTTPRLMLWYAVGTTVLEAGGMQLMSHDGSTSLVPPDQRGLYLALEHKFRRADSKSRPPCKSARDTSASLGKRRVRVVDDDDSSNERAPLKISRGRKPSGARLRQQTWSLVIVDTLRCGASKVVQTAAVMAARESLGSVPEAWLILNHAKADERMGGA